MPLPLDLVPSLARAADIATRNDAAAGLWSGERDYVAAFLATLRNSWRLHGGEAELRMRNLGANAEKRVGCDFLIVLQGDYCFKYGLFEAKWVRPPARHAWDYGSPPSRAAKKIYYAPPLTVPRKISHFSDQLARQQRWLSLLARAKFPEPFVAEMFLQLAAPGAGGPPYDDPTLFDQEGATFLWHRDARKRIDPPVGSPPQFTPLKHWSSGGGALIVSALTALAPPQTIEGVLDSVLLCLEGRPVHGRWEHRPRAFARLTRARNVLLLHGVAPPAWQERRG